MASNSGKRVRKDFCPREGRHKERGQTLVLVALSLVSLLAMAALAIDVVTLYTARTEIQRAADAAALAGAKAFVDSGVTTDPTNTARRTLAQSVANSIINALLAQNNVAGSPAVVVGTPAFDFDSHPGNPQITVRLQRTGLPIFFARIWSRALASVSATATAEAYNPSGYTVPIQPRCVKPFLVANKDPNHGSAPFVIIANGTTELGVVGETLILANLCPAAGLCTPIPGPAPGYYPALVSTNTANLCPACQGASTFENSIECCDANAYSCGGTLTNVTVDKTLDGNQNRLDTSAGLQCLVHTPNDTLDDLNLGNFTASTAPLEIRSNSGPQSGRLVTTSNSVVTIPIIDSLNTITGEAIVVGFLQAFVRDVDFAGVPGQMRLVVLNVAGCGPTQSGSPIAGGGATPIPVRLIH